MEIFKSVFTLFLFFVAAVFSQSTGDLWWQSANIYQVVPLSFKDTNGDGIGDIRGIISELDYFVETGIDALLLSPFFETNLVDMGYDITNYVEIDEKFGTWSDVDELFMKAKNKNLKIILDFVPNHTSNKNQWFINSEISLSGFEDFYIWHDGKPSNGSKPFPPNNWTSEYGGSAWEWSGLREAYYYHKFSYAQPDLNLREERVIEKLDEILKFWIDKGSDGFRIDAVSQLFEDPAFLNVPDIGTQNFELFERWRALIDNYSSSKVLIPQVWNSPISELVNYYQNQDGTTQRAQIPTNFIIINQLSSTSDAIEIKQVIESYLSALPDGAIANWFLGSHDHNRVASRMGKEKIDGLMILVQTLPGISFTYYGDEIGMEDNNEISWDETKDIQACNFGNLSFSRDVARTPFQWNSSKNAGFSSGKPWLPVHSSFTEHNLDSQMNANWSHYKLFKELLLLRKNETFIRGNLDMIALNKNVLAYSRSYSGTAFIIAINFGNESETLDVSVFNTNFKEQSAIHIMSTHSTYEVNELINIKNLNLSPFDAVVIKYSSASKISLSLFSVALCILFKII